MNKTIYISGKITYNHIENRLSSMGYKVVKPETNNETRPWGDAVRSDIKRMLECDEVHLLPDWQESPGAQLERDIALRLGMQVVYH